MSGSGASGNKFRMSVCVNPFDQTEILYFEVEIIERMGDQ